MTELPAIETDRDLFRVLRMSGVKYPLSTSGWPPIEVKGYPGKEMVDYLVQKAVEMHLLIWIPAAWVEDVQRSMVRELLAIAQTS